MKLRCMVCASAASRRGMQVNWEYPILEKRENLFASYQILLAKVLQLFLHEYYTKELENSNAYK